MAHNPEIHAMGPVQWQLFATLTFSRESLPDKVRITLWFSFLRELARMADVPFRNVLWLLRAETGESTGRFHYHALIGGLPQSFCSIANCFRLQLVWDHEPEKRAPKWSGKTLRVGMARIRKFDSQLEGVSYVLKGLGEMPSGADIYEFSKFAAGTSAVMLSDSLFRHVEVSRKWSSQERRRQRQKDQARAER